MPIRFPCPNGHRLIVPDERAGKKGRCPECGVRVYVPAPAGSPAHMLPPTPAGVEDFDDGEPIAAEDRFALEPTDLCGWDDAPLAAAPVAGVPSAATVAEFDEFAAAPLAAAPLATAPPPLPDGGDLAAPPLAASLAPPLAEEANSVPPVAGSAPAVAVPPVVAVLDEQLTVERPDAGKLQTVYMLALGLIALALFGAAPAVRDLNVITAPGWVWVVLLVAALQVVYVAWMLSLPDWSTVWIGMIVYAAAAAVYGLAWALLGLTPAENEIGLFGLDGLDRGQAAGWCAAISLLTLLLTYACGRVSSRWRRAWELRRGNAEFGMRNAELEEKAVEMRNSEFGIRNSE